VVYIETTTDDLIVLNPRWLCEEVLGKLLGDMEQLPADGRLSFAHLSGLFPNMDVADSVTILSALELCSIVAAGTWYQVSCRNSLPVPYDDWKSDCPPYVGGVALVADSTAHLRCIFSRLQHAIWNASVDDRPSEWSGGIQFRGSSESSPDCVITIRVDTEEDEDVIRIICRSHDPQSLYQQQQKTAVTVLRVIDTCCPGVFLQLRALSPRDIREVDRPRPRMYSALEVSTAQLDGREEVRIDGDEEQEESLKDVLAFGDETLFDTLRPGVELHVSELPMFTRCRLAALLDPPHPQGRDWLLLALGLGLGDFVPQVDATETASLSRTDRILAVWSRNDDSTIRRLLGVVRQTLQRPDVEQTLLELTPFCRLSSHNPRRSASPSTENNDVFPANCNHS